MTGHTGVVMGRLGRIVAVVGVVVSLLLVGAGSAVADTPQRHRFEKSLSGSWLRGWVNVTLSGAVSLPNTPTGAYTVTGEVEGSCPWGYSIRVNQKISPSTEWRRIEDMKCSDSGNHASVSWDGKWDDATDDKMLIDVCLWDTWGIDIKLKCTDDVVIRRSR